MEHKRPKAFNEFLKEQMKGVSSHIGFWESMRKERIGLIAVNDCSSGVSSEEAQSFLKSLPTPAE